MPRERTIDIPVAGGLHAGVPSQSVPRGFSPDLRNFVPSGANFIVPRSALSTRGTIGAAALGASEIFDVNGNQGGVVSTTTRPWYLHPENATWSALSYLPGTIASWSTGNLSGLSTDYIEFETIFSPDKERTITVLSNNTSMVKFFEFSDSAATFSDFTWIDSMSSAKAARDVTSINNRLVFFNVLSSDGTRWPTRVMWSARGNPLSYLIADGAGAEDLKDMRGVGQAIVRHRDFLLLFTELEIWRATPTFDDYAFRFDRAIGDMGTPWPRTIAVTPFGVVFLGRDFEVYATDGSSMVPLGSIGGEGPSRIADKIQGEISSPLRAWATYNQADNRYELYYAITGSTDQYPTRALWFDFTTRTWWPQTFSHAISAGCDANDNVVTTPGQPSYNSTYGRHVRGVTSSGTMVEFASAKTSDEGTAIDVRWRSPGLKNGVRKAHLKEIWIDADVDSASSASVWLGSARSGSVFTAEREVRLATTNDLTFVPCWTTDNAPAFEIRINDGSRPRIAAFSATLQDASKF